MVFFAVAGTRHWKCHVRWLAGAGWAIVAALVLVVVGGA